MKSLRQMSFALLALGVLAGAAAAPPEPGAEAAWVQQLALPPLLPTRAVITALPQVQAARAGQALAQARGEGLQAGSHEWTLRAGTQRRTETGGAQFMEQELALERSIRWGGKADTDRSLGQAGVSAAQAAYADVWHEAVRGLLQGWYDWQRARSAVRVQNLQTALAQEQFHVATRRVLAGDVPRLDALMAEAERDRMLAQLQLAQGQEQVLRSDLIRRFPGLVLGDDVAETTVTPDSLQLTGDVAQWEQRILADNHELELAESEVLLARLQSERARQETRPDPMLGVRAARERGGAENVVGVYMAIPLSGVWRDAEQRAALAQLDAAEQRLLQTRQRVQAAAQRVALRARHAQAAWQHFASVAQAMARVAQLGVKAYGLGEMSLTEALQSRRAALEAALANEAARWDALESASRLLVDAHQLWAADEQGH